MVERSSHSAEAITPEESGSRVLYQDGQLCITQVTPPDTVRLKGDIDITNSPAVADVLARITAQWGRVVVDTAELRFIDISGWRVLIAPDASSAAQPELVNIAPCVRRLTRRMTTL